LNIELGAVIHSSIFTPEGFIFYSYSSVARWSFAGDSETLQLLQRRGKGCQKAACQ
jgi:hypothetical protein